MAETVFNSYLYLLSPGLLDPEKMHVQRAFAELKCFTIDSLMETVNRNFMSYSIVAIVSGCEPLEAWGEGGFRFSEETDVDLAKQGTRCLCPLVSWISRWDAKIGGVFPL